MVDQYNNLNNCTVGEGTWLCKAALLFWLFGSINKYPKKKREKGLEVFVTTDCVKHISSDSRLKAW